MKMKMKRKSLMLLLVMFVCTAIMGCKVPAKQEYGSTYISTSSYTAYPVDFRLDDGTRCVAILGYGKAGLSCDWNDIGKSR